MAERPPLQPGDLLGGQYTVRALISETVTLQRLHAATSWGEPVIAEVFTAPDPDTPGGQRFKQAYLRAARSLAQVQHAAVPRVLDLSERHTDVLLVLEDRARQTLRAAFLPDADTVQALFLALFAGLGAAHAAAVIHGAVSPDALTVDAQGAPCLTGFRLEIKGLEEQRQPVAHDPRYAAPELVEGGRVSPQTDLYALAATLHELISGRAPASAAARQRGVLMPPLPSGTAPGIAAALDAALQLDPAQRAVSAREVLEIQAKTAAPEPPPADVASPLTTDPMPEAAPVPERAIPATPPVLTAPGGGWVRWLVPGLIAAVALLGLLRLIGGHPEPSSAPTASVAPPTIAAPEPPVAVPESAAAPQNAAVPSEPATTELTVQRTVVVTSPGLNLRAEPDEQVSVVGAVPMGTALGVLEEEDGWLHVQSGDGQGWVKAAFTAELRDPQDLEQALSSLRAGGSVQLQEGVYLLQEPLILDADVSVTGAGAGRTFLMGASAEDTVIIQGVRAELTGLTVAHIGAAFARTLYQRGGDLTLSGATLTGARRDPQGSAYGSDLWVAEGGRAHLSGDTLTQAAFGLYVSDDSQVDAEDSAFSGNSEGGALFKDQSGGSISSSRFSDNAAHGLHVFGSAAPVVTGSRFTGNGGRGVTVYGDASPSLSSSTVADNRLQGVGVQGTARPTIRDNTVEHNAQSGLTFFDSSGGEASGNHVQDNGVAGISVTGSSAPSLNSNTVTGNTGNGISFADTAGGTAEGNTVSGNGAPGIAVWGSASPSLQTNAVSRNKQSGVVIVDQAHPSLQANHVEGNALYGIVISGSATPQLSQNLVESNGKGGLLYKENAGGTMDGDVCSGNSGPNFGAMTVAGSAGPSNTSSACQ